MAVTLFHHALLRAQTTGPELDEETRMSNLTRTVTDTLIFHLQDLKVVTTEHDWRDHVPRMVERLQDMSFDTQADALLAAETHEQFRVACAEGALALFHTTL